MKKSRDVPQRCVVRGEDITVIGSLNELQRGGVEGTFKVPDGFNSNYGPICRFCFPAYRCAIDAASVQGVPNSQSRTFLKDCLQDPRFVAKAISDNARERIFLILGNIDEEQPWDNLVVRSLKKFFLGGIKIADYERLDEKALGSDDIPDDIMGLSHAMGCILDEKRTIKFIRGLFAKLNELEGKREKVEVVDAGCGPIPLFGILAALKSDKVQVTCLECNRISADLAERIIHNLGLSDRVKVMNVDAKTYRHPRSIDLLVSETIYSGLIDESFVQILGNLEAYVAEDGFVIPEWVTVDAGLISPEEKERSAMIYPTLCGNFGGGVALTEVARVTRGRVLREIRFVLSAADLAAGIYHLVLSSRVGIANGTVLERGESVITSPYALSYEIPLFDSGYSGIEVAYIPGTISEDIVPRVV